MKSAFCSERNTLYGKVLEASIEIGDNLPEVGDYTPENPALRPACNALQMYLQTEGWIDKSGAAKPNLGIIGTFNQDISTKKYIFTISAYREIDERMN